MTFSPGWSLNDNKYILLWLLTKVFCNLHFHFCSQCSHFKLIHFHFCSHLSSIPHFHFCAQWLIFTFIPPLWYTFTFIHIASLSLSVPLHDGVPALLPDPRVGLRPHPRLPHFPLRQWSRQGTRPSGKTERWQCEREACVVTFNLLLAGPRQPTC